jgi:hypothetical protein
MLALRKREWEIERGKQRERERGKRGREEPTNVRERKGKAGGKLGGGRERKVLRLKKEVCVYVRVHAYRSSVSTCALA